MIKIGDNGYKVNRKDDFVDMVQNVSLNKETPVYMKLISHIINYIPGVNIFFASKDSKVLLNLYFEHFVENKLITNMDTRQLNNYSKLTKRKTKISFIKLISSNENLLIDPVNNVELFADITHSVVLEKLFENELYLSEIINFR